MTALDDRAISTYAIGLKYTHKGTIRATVMNSVVSTVPLAIELTTTRDITQIYKEMPMKWLRIYTFLYLVA